MTDRENIIGETSLQPHRTNVEYINDINVDRRLEIQQVTRNRTKLKKSDKIEKKKENLRKMCLKLTNGKWRSLVFVFVNTLWFVEVFGFSLSIGMGSNDHLGSTGSETAKPYKISVGQNEIICREVSRDYS